MFYETFVMWKRILVIIHIRKQSNFMQLHLLIPFVWMLQSVFADLSIISRLSCMINNSFILMEWIRYCTLDVLDLTSHICYIVISLANFMLTVSSQRKFIQSFFYNFFFSIIKIKIKQKQRDESNRSSEVYFKLIKE